MSEKRAKRLRREARERGDLPKRKQFFVPITIPMPTGKKDKEGNMVMEDTYVPRRQRRLIMRRFMTSVRKGRIDIAKLLQEKAEREAQSDRTV